MASLRSRRPRVNLRLGPLSPLGLASLVVVLGFGARPAGASHNLLSNGNFDGGIAGWTLEQGPGSVAEMAWDPAAGSPSLGSLVVTGTQGDSWVSIAEALSECVEVEPGGRYFLRGRVYVEEGAHAVRCIPYVTAYEEPGCGGGRLRLGTSTGFGFTEPGAWRERLQLFTTSWTSARVALTTIPYRGSGPATCRFDSLLLFQEGTGAPYEVPVLSRTGTLALVTAFGIAALWLLRHPG